MTRKYLLNWKCLWNGYLKSFNPWKLISKGRKKMDKKNEPAKKYANSHDFPKN